MTNEPSYRRLLWILALIGVTVDIGSKYIAFRNLDTDANGQHVSQSGQGEKDVFPGKFKFIVQFTPNSIEASTWRGPLQSWNGPTMPRVNHGALFGLGNTGLTTSNGMFMAISVVAAVVIAIWSIRGSSTTDRILCCALGLILGGTLGNLFDRIVFHGVRDFMYFYWFEWPVFNFADCCLVCGAGLLVIQAIWPTKAKTDQQQPPMKMVAAL